MKKLLSEWRKKLQEFEITGIDYEAGVAQEEPPAPLSGPDAELHKALTVWAENWKTHLAATNEPNSLDLIPHAQREKLLKALVSQFNVWSGKTLGVKPVEENPPQDITAVDRRMADRTAPEEL
tara:strand:- start:181 stop:549 length:369 start_codon:yes stop_codon:yes gene_type:complete